MAQKWFVKRSNICAKMAWTFFYNIILISMQNYYNNSIKLKEILFENVKKKEYNIKKYFDLLCITYEFMTYIVLKWHAWQLHNLNHSTCYLLPLSGSFWEPLVWIGLDRDIIVVRRTVSDRSAIWRFDGVAIFMLPKSAIFPLEMPWLYRKGDDD